MIGILNFFGGAMLTPALLLRLKILLAIAAATALLCLGLTTWALLERSGRLELKVDVVRLEDQVRILVDQLKRQSAAVLDVSAIGDAIRGDIREELERLASAAGKRDPILLELEELVRRATPLKMDGRPASCSDAWLEIERRAKQ